jgi:hypothetical protein
VHVPLLLAQRVVFSDGEFSGAQIGEVERVKVAHGSVADQARPRLGNGALRVDARGDLLALVEERLAQLRAQVARNNSVVYEPDFEVERRHFSEDARRPAVALRDDDFDGSCEREEKLRDDDIVKDVRGSESNCEQDSR